MGDRDFPLFPCASCQEQEGFKRKHPGLCQANVGWVLWMLSSCFMTRKSCTQLFHFLNQWIIQRRDLVHNVALEKNQNKCLTQCSPGKLLVHVSDKALRVTPPVYQLFRVYHLDIYFLVQLFPISIWSVWHRAGNMGFWLNWQHLWVFSPLNSHNCSLWHLQSLGK